MRKLEFPDPFMHDHPPVRELSDIDPGLSSKGEKFTDWVYENLGSWRFILIQSILVAVWVLLNATAYLQTWDPYPFIFMNLIFSLQSAYSASLILISQNRQERLKAVLDNFAAQNKALEEIYRELLSLKTEMKNL